MICRSTFKNEVIFYPLTRNINRGKEDLPTPTKAKTSGCKVRMITLPKYKLLSRISQTYKPTFNKIITRYKNRNEENKALFYGFMSYRKGYYVNIYYLCSNYDS